ncbi:M23 family metallopeptidase [Sphingomonas pokkalii]|uniref:Peptidase M23 n=1 Tax=Sphingomonas pokkalii TaxID=2175090 RepID=A0A2U0SHH7_9SPHN|nr:M23 family metallopeptidase [Sphingomonas pokkalii]PVX30800.1 peptidase M23 [Sphingomonas pokkalii]
MAVPSERKNDDFARKFRDFFTTRDFILHDGRGLRRFSICGRSQALFASAAAMTIVFSGYGVSQAMAGAIAYTAATPGSPEAQVAAMRAEVARMRTEVAQAKEQARQQAAQIAQRQAVLNAVVSGKADRSVLAQELPALPQKTSALTGEITAPLRRLEARQVALAAKAQQVGEARVRQATLHFQKLGLPAARFVKAGAAMGGPYEPASDEDAGTTAVAADADAQFRSLFLTWKKLDSIEQSSMTIPSLKPVEHVSFTSMFGVRSDPFRGSAAMHTGVDIPGAMGTPIYATADGIVSHAGRQGGYGNLVEINHGHGIETRYGHLSKILVADNTRVHRGQIIGLMGSTGRSTGTHLHYEVRLDGRAINPIPFIQSGEYASQTPVTGGAMGGPR